MEAEGEWPKKRNLTFLGLPVAVEIEVGETKSGVDPLGKEWSHEYKYPYGEVTGSEGADGDPVDVYLGPDEDSETVFVVHQVDHLGAYDEDKVMLGFSKLGQALRCYSEHGPEWGFGSVDTMTLGQFREGYLASNRVSGYMKNSGAESKVKQDPRVERAFVEGGGPNGSQVIAYLKPGYAWDECHQLMEDTWKAAAESLGRVKECRCEECVLLMKKNSAELRNPSPMEGESEADYVSRFMGDAEANRSYPDADQRCAVAHNWWREKNNSMKMPEWWKSASLEDRRKVLQANDESTNLALVDEYEALPQGSRQVLGQLEPPFENKNSKDPYSLYEDPGRDSATQEITVAIQSGSAARVISTMKKHSKLGAEDTASRDAIISAAKRQSKELYGELMKKLGLVENKNAFTCTSCTFKSTDEKEAQAHENSLAVANHLVTPSPFANGANLDGRKFACKHCGQEIRRSALDQACPNCGADFKNIEDVDTGERAHLLMENSTDTCSICTLRKKCRDYRVKGEGPNVFERLCDDCARKEGRSEKDVVPDVKYNSNVSEIPCSFCSQTGTTKGYDPEGDKIKVYVCQSCAAKYFPGALVVENAHEHRDLVMPCDICKKDMCPYCGDTDNDSAGETYHRGECAKKYKAKKKAWDKKLGNSLKVGDVVYDIYSGEDRPGKVTAVHDTSHVAVSWDNGTKSDNLDVKFLRDTTGGRRPCSCEGECGRTEPGIKHEGRCKNWNLPPGDLCVTCDVKENSVILEKKNSNEKARLVYQKTGKEVKVGDLVKDFRGDEGKVTGVSRKPHKPDSEGHVEVDGMESYAGVYGMKWVDRDDGRSKRADNSVENAACTSCHHTGEEHNELGCTVPECPCSQVENTKSLDVGEYRGFAISRNTEATHFSAKSAAGLTASGSDLAQVRLAIDECLAANEDNSVKNSILNSFTRERVGAFTMGTGASPTATRCDKCSASIAAGGDVVMLTEGSPSDGNKIALFCSSCAPSKARVEAMSEKELVSNGFKNSEDHGPLGEACECGHARRLHADTSRYMDNSGACDVVGGCAKGCERFRGAGVDEGGKAYVSVSNAAKAGLVIELGGQKYTKWFDHPEDRDQWVDDNPMVKVLEILNAGVPKKQGEGKYRLACVCSHWDDMHGENGCDGAYGTWEYIDHKPGPNEGQCTCKKFQHYPEWDEKERRNVEQSALGYQEATRTTTAEAEKKNDEGDLCMKCDHPRSDHTGAGYGHCEEENCDCDMFMELEENKNAGDPDKCPACEKPATEACELCEVAGRKYCLIHINTHRMHNPLPGEQSVTLPHEREDLGNSGFGSRKS